MKTLVTTPAKIMTATAPRRSAHGTRLKKIHHTRIASVQTTAPMIPSGAASGTTRGTTNLSITSTAAAATPGHSRSGLDPGSLTRATDMLEPLPFGIRDPGSGIRDPRPTLFARECPDRIDPRDAQ